jgi:hypothetical protein
MSDTDNAMIEAVKLAIKTTYTDALATAQIQTEDDRFRFRINFAWAFYEAFCECAGRSYAHRLFEEVAKQGRLMPTWPNAPH